MSKKKENYLPTHDHFYGDFAQNPENYVKKIYEETNVYKLAKKNITLNFTPPEDYQIRDFSFEVGNKSNGLWDLVIKCKAIGSNVDFAFCIEYKTSIEESQINELLRQIQNRKKPRYIAGQQRQYEARKSFASVKILATFDQRFEKYRPVIENENISLVILDKDKIFRIKKEFDLSDSDGKDSNLNSFQ